MQMIVKHLEDLSINSNTKQTDNFFESDKCPELPLSTKEQFDAFMEKLMSNSFLKQVAAASGKIGGRDLSNIVTNICVKFVSNSLAMNYSWTGRKKPKLALQNTNFAKLMMAAVRINKPQAKDNEISELVSKWFAGAKKRVDRGDNKENNKNEEDLNNSISDDETQDPLENDADDEN
ncbi:uncharacterized protein LOC122506381 [Leptopilina heterotoma]|uniref:uncharacterized protein LOC122506381 n=1 Tax=Leptopilina heterotoma TaxID=63436 RepID=UPI001CA84FBA|nr:uncharacterized protein LOC122506381 [Leptopilina heterotoma]